MIRGAWALITLTASSELKITIGVDPSSRV